MNYKNLIVEKENRLAVVTLNRPQSLNALNQELLGELSHFFDVAKTDNDIRLVILTGSGEKSFVAGADIKEFVDYDATVGTQRTQEYQTAVFDKIEAFPKPVIAAVNGFALGGGLELALSCHFRIASENAKLGLPEVTLGLIPGYGGTQRLPQLIGKGLAMQAIFSAEMFNAQRAEQIGLVNEVVPQAELLSRCKAIADKILKNSSSALAKAIEAINASNTPAGFKVEINSFGELCGTPDFKEGTAAFIEKRKANFQ